MKHKPFWIQSGPCFLLPILHDCMEMAALTHRAIWELKPDCIAVELPASIESAFITSAARLPDITLIHHGQQGHSALYLSHPCDPAFEALRTSIEHNLPAHCIDLPIAAYPKIWDPLPDPHSLHQIGHKTYCQQVFSSWEIHPPTQVPIDSRRELFMAKQLRSLSFSHDRILIVVGMKHVHGILRHLSDPYYPTFSESPLAETRLTSPNEESCRQILPDGGWLTSQYEKQRTAFQQHREKNTFSPDRQSLLYQLYKKASVLFCQREKISSFPQHTFSLLLQFAYNYARITGRLIPNLFQIITAAKGCIDHHYAYYVWLLATSYEERRNIDGLQEIAITPEEIWGTQKKILFHRSLPSRKWGFAKRQQNEKKSFSFQPFSPYSLCSFPKEDVAIEQFGDFLQKKAGQILLEEGTQVVRFSTSLEDGIDARETIRNWFEKHIYVRVQGRPKGKVGSVVVIFDQDLPATGFSEKYPFCTTWLGEHNQESDMAFFSTPLGGNLVGPGISCCEYGGFLMSYPPRRMRDVWSDPDYSPCRNKSEVLLMAGIDYAMEKIIVYVADRPPRSWLKGFAKRFGKKIVYLPIGQLSPFIVRKLRRFHILDGQNRREIADQYIY